ncbi:ATPase [filamentous cyanobacterium CCP5]|nr:ATPase [filamentous cyanobacterium CCP5]
MNHQQSKPFSEPFFRTDGFTADEASSLLTQILNGVADPIFIKDTQHLWRFVNRAFCDLFGYDAKLLLGKSEQEFWPLEATRCLEIEQAVFETGQEQTYESVLCDANGSEHVVVIKIEPLSGMGESAWVVGTVLDVTQQRQSEEKLRQQAERERILGAIAQHLIQSLSSEQMLERAVEAICRFLRADRVLFLSCDPDYQGILAEATEPGITPYVGSTVGSSLESLGLSSDRLSAYHLGQFQIIPGLAAEPATDAALESLRVKACLVIPVIQAESLYGLITVHHGQVREWQTWEIDTLQEVAAQIGSALNQTRLYKQVSQLNAALEQQIDQRSEELRTALQFEATLKRITDRVRDSLDEKQIMLTAVREVTEALEAKGSNTSLYDLEQGTSKIYYEYNRSLPSYQGRVALMEAFPEVYNQLLQGQYFQFCSKEPNPARGRVSMLACPILDDRGVLGDLWLINDESYGFNEIEIRLVQQVANQCAIAIRQAHLYKAAQIQVEELERLNQLKDDFLSTVSHELRTPVTSMRVALQLLGVTLNRELDLDGELQKSKPEQAPVARYYQILKEECEREISLINDLLDLQRLDVGNHPVNPEPVVLGDWLPTLVNGFTPRTRNRDQSLDLNLPVEDLVIHTDLASLERILAELLNNACKYTPPGETIRLEVTELVEAGDTLVQFQLANTGVEIPETEMTRIFDKFYRVPSADPWKQGGTGLGLALVEKLVLYIGGKIAVDSGDGQTCFTITLPRQLAAA